MYKLYIMALLLFVLGLIVESLNKEKTKPNELKVVNSPMTQTEIDFIRQLEIITNKYKLKIIPQIQLQKIFKTTNITEFNKIKSKSIDFAIVDNDYNYKLFIELDDYTHSYDNRIKRDNYINNLFETNNLKLLRIKVKNNYNIEQLEDIIKEVA